MSKRAIILAGGKGTRLRPYTIVLPKPLVPIGQYPILEIIVRQLSYYGFDHITIAINHQAEIIKAYFGDGSKWNTSIDYSLEDTPLSTMGPLKLIHDLPENFLVMNGDILTNLNFNNLYKNHVDRGNIFTISAYAREEKVDYGVLEMDQRGFLSNFREKPVAQYIVSMGIYMINRKILKFIPESKPYGFDNLMHDLLKTNILPKVYMFKGYWLDIGRSEDYMIAINEFEKNKKEFIKEKKK